MNETAEDSYWPRNCTEFGDGPESGQRLARTLWDNGKWEIPFYSAIFLLSVVGNTLVILTLGKNTRMRTITNVFLLNLAASDLVLAVLCMPFTLIGTLLRNFIFGSWMCKLVPFLQATSVAASVWTLVALSIERYYAICHPLRSRKWQTLSHARRLIGSIWAGGALAMSPILVLTELQPTKKGHYKCRENWPDGDYERAYNLFLDLLLLVVPLLALAATYYLIATTLWKDLKFNQTGNASSFVKGRESSSQYQENSASPEVTSYPSRSIRSHDGDVIFRAGSDGDESSVVRGQPTDAYEYACLGADLKTVKASDSSLICFKRKQKVRSETDEELVEARLGIKWTRKVKKADLPSVTARIGLRQTNYERSLIYKQRVIKMLFVVVLEFFICWTPLYVINTLALFWPQMVYSTIGYKTISFCQLLAYTSGCCNPITYCFMNKGFRTSFINMFTCQKTK